MCRFITNTIALFILIASSSVNMQGQNKIKIDTPKGEYFQDYMIEIPTENLKLPMANYLVKNKTKNISPLEITTDIFGSQHAILCIDGVNDHNRTFEIVKGNMNDYPKRTQAELTHKIGGHFMGKEYIGGYSWVKASYLTLPGTFRDHSYYLKYEGPGWENDKVAFRFYLDNRNAIDPFGKSTNALVLSTVGADGFDSYHKLANWGMDNTKVGSSLGLGSIAYWNGKNAERVAKRDSTTCIIEIDGKLRSQIRTIYDGWKVADSKVDLTTLISIDAGSRMSHIELLTEQKIDNLATGIIKIKEGKLLNNPSEDGEWSYIATFGKQSMNKDMQGLAVFFKRSQLQQLTEDELSHVVVLTPDDRKYVEYYIMSTWELDTEPIVNEKDFISCVNERVNYLNNKNKYTIIK